MEIEVNKDWNKQAGLEKSEWLAENVKGFDQSVKEMLNLIEHDGDFAKSELIACVRDISQRHQLLADHYSKLMGELNCNVQAENGINSYEKASFLTPCKKLKTDDLIVLSGSSPSPGGEISDATQHEGSESTLLSSDSDSESYNSSHNSDLEMEGFMITRSEQHTKKGECGECEKLLRQILDHENELKASTEKLQYAEDEIARLKSDLEKNEAVIFNFGNLEDELMSAKNQITLLDSEIEQENRRSLALHTQILDLEGKLESAQLHVLELQGSITKQASKLSDRDHVIAKLNAELQDTTGNFALEKWQLESSISNLTQSLGIHETRAKELQMQCDHLSDEIRNLEAGKVEMEENHVACRIYLQADIEDLHCKLIKKNIQVDALNEALDSLQQMYDTLMAEKDVVVTKIQTANDQIKLLEQSLQKLHSENNQISAENSHSNKLIDELKSRIDELENEIGMQTTKTNDVAEEKREAIRQLCFMLDYFRSAYEDMRDAHAPRSRRAATVAS